jgi:RHS repeat-associated protein
VTYTYDNDGNLISATTSTGMTTYTYDYENRLTNVTQSGTIIATYTYDALGRRIGIEDSGGGQTWTVYNGNTADANAYADSNSSGGVTMRYLFGPAVDQILARTSSSGTTAWYLTDQLGSVRYIESTSGSVLDEITYDPFGNIVSETEPANGDRFKFAGMEYDSLTGLYYDHARFYDPAIGRFIGKDPIGFSAGDTNLYRYVGNSPTIAADRSGLIVLPPTIIAVHIGTPIPPPPIWIPEPPWRRRSPPLGGPPGQKPPNYSGWGWTWKWDDKFGWIAFPNRGVAD